MLQYNTRSTYEAPDPSAIQQWKRKLEPREIALVELKTKPLLLERRYQLSGLPLKPVSAIENLKLVCKNKIYIWKFHSTRLGVFNVVMEKLTRRLLPPLHPFFVKRINEIWKLYDK
jgi:hypothetical protein